jgi:mono/diheme cytochrome c family protein
MDELRQAPTRPLDDFEATSLAKLREGKDILAAESAQYLRVLGSIRSVKQCIDCHGGERGDLLGAFSYTLRRKTN